jgi:DNA topoisomerase I
VSDDEPGYARRRRGRGFQYVDTRGRGLSSAATVDRIRSLAIPPAWTDVWICRYANGHLQATGRDARGRKQYRYHPRWREARDATKYGNMIEFGRALPRIRRRVDRDLARRTLDRKKVVATVVRLLDATALRVGNEEYARENRSFGLTTMRDRHAAVNGSELRLTFRGKGGQTQDVELHDRRLARAVKRCQDLPGQQLFQYIDDDGGRVSVTSDDVNEYLREASGGDFTAKDFRTWTGTVLAAWALDDLGEYRTQTQAKRQVVRAVESVAADLGNTPAVCRQCYIHPDVFGAHLDRTLGEVLEAEAERKLSRDLKRLSPHEAAVLGLLTRRLAAG